MVGGGVVVGAWVVGVAAVVVGVVEEAAGVSTLVTGTTSTSGVVVSIRPFGVVTELVPSSMTATSGAVAAMSVSESLARKKMNPPMRVAANARINESGSTWPSPAGTTSRRDGGGVGPVAETSGGTIILGFFSAIASVCNPA